MNMSQMNGNNRRSSNLNNSKVPSTCAQHEDIIKYIHESWVKVSAEADRNPANSSIYHREPEHVKHFEPFNLEKFMEQRQFRNYQHL